MITHDRTTVPTFDAMYIENTNIDITNANGIWNETKIPPPADSKSGSYDHTNCDYNSSYKEESK
jgi:hypothetical protein